ncbi:MAG: aminotransferase class V-fold PLP-dependent enzyme [Bacteroidales bacterium]
MITRNTYFDNASTSFPKPKKLVEAMMQYTSYFGGTYGRSSYNKVQLSTTMYEIARTQLAILMDVEEDEKVFFTMNATMASNTLIQTYPFTKDTKVWVSPLEHNAIMRPLYEMSNRIGFKIQVLPHEQGGKIHLEALKKMDKSDFDLIIVNHISNVSGLIQPVAELGEWCDTDIELWLDCTQSLGAVKCKLDKWNVDAAIFTGHKALMGPTGTGGFFVRNPDKHTHFMYGGTGSNSHSYLMPNTYPEKFEVGTPNMIGVIALGHVVPNLPRKKYTRKAFRELIERLESNPKITLYSDSAPDSQSSVFSFTHAEYTPSELSELLYKEYDIQVRSGMHCAPLAHKTLGTYPNGTVRVSLSPYHTNKELIYLAECIEALDKEHLKQANEVFNYTTQLADGFES